VNSRMMLEHLEDLASKMDIKVRYEQCRSRGGFCRVDRNRMIIVRKTLTLPEKVEVIAGALCRMPFEKVYTLPEVRKLLEETAEKDLKRSKDLE